MWDAWPKLNSSVLRILNASEEQLDQMNREQRYYEERVIEDEGPIKGRIRIYDEELEALVDRVSSLMSYARQAEDWKNSVKSEYVLVRKDLVSRLSEHV